VDLKNGAFRLLPRFVVIGWALDRHLEDDLAIAALRMARRRRTLREGLTHHSPRSSKMPKNRQRWRRR
jgi:hypothetical protein